MDRRVVSLGGFALTGLAQALDAALAYGTTTLFDVAFRLAVGLLLAGLFGAYLVRGDDLNGLARRPLFVVIGAASGVVSLVYVAVILLG